MIMKFLKEIRKGKLEILKEKDSNWYFKLLDVIIFTSIESRTNYKDFIRFTYKAFAVTIFFMMVLAILNRYFS